MKKLSLNEIKHDQLCTIIDLSAEGALGQRLVDLGFYPGAQAKIIRNAPLVDPVEIDLDGTFLTVRHGEAEHIFVRLNTEIQDANQQCPTETLVKEEKRDVR